MSRITEVRRPAIHVPQLVGRVSYPQSYEKPELAMRRLVSELDTAMQELQRFLRYLQSSNDNVVQEAGYYAEEPELVDSGTGSYGTPGVGYILGDHKHQADVGAPTGLGNASAIGSGPKLAHNDHVHKRDVRVKAAGVDVATRNALDLRNTSSIYWTVTDDPGNDEVDATLTLAPVFPGIVSTAIDRTVLSTDFVIFVDASGGDRTITLPAANALTGRWLEVKKVDSSANKVILDAAGADTIEGDATLELLIEGEAVPIVSDGTSAWYVL